MSDERSFPTDIEEQMKFRCARCGCVYARDFEGRIEYRRRGRLSVPVTICDACHADDAEE